MQISGDDFLKKVQLKQEKDELEKKLNELDETRISMSNINLTNNLNNAYKGLNNNDVNEMDRLQRNIEFDENGNHEFDNIMLNQPLSNTEDNKKKYLILGIVLVVLFLLTIIIIRLLTGDSKKEDPFTSNSANSTEMKTLSENSNNIEDRYQRILDDRVKKDATDPVVPAQSNTNDKLESIKETKEEVQVPLNEIKQNSTISNETIDETIKKIEDKKASTKSVDNSEKTVAKTTTEPRKSIKDLVEGNSSKQSGGESSSANGYFVQIGAFSKRPSDSYLKNIANQGFKYKVIQEDVKGTTYNKLLIGPYSSKAAAQGDVSSIKDRLNVANTFIVNY